MKRENFAVMFKKVLLLFACLAFSLYLCIRFRPKIWRWLSSLTVLHETGMAVREARPRVARGGRFLFFSRAYASRPLFGGAAGTFKDTLLYNGEFDPGSG